MEGADIRERNRQKRTNEILSKDNVFQSVRVELVETIKKDCPTRSDARRVEALSEVFCRLIQIAESPII